MMRHSLRSLMTVRSNFVFCIISLLVFIQLTRIFVYSPQNEKDYLHNENYENESFVIPILLYGPNNQIEGLREALFIAEIIKKKLILPAFFDHYTADASRGLLSPDDVIDTSALERHFHVVHAGHKLSDLCDGKLEVVVDFSAGDFPKYRKKSLDWLGISDDQIKKARRFTFTSKNLSLPNFSQAVRQSISRFSNAKCIILENPFYLINWKEFSQDVNQINSSEYELGKEIVSATSRPLKLKQSAVDILKGMRIDKFGALHWRYDAKDFMKVRKDYEKVIHKTREIRVNPEPFCQSLKEYLKSAEIRVLIIFTPPSDEEFASVLKKTLHPLKVYTDEDIIKFIKDKTPDEMEPFEYSLLSQELSFLSDTFIFSTMSTWSRNVLVERTTNGVLSNKLNLDFVNTEDNDSDDARKDFSKTEEIQKTFEKRVEIMRKSCSVLPELEALAQNEAKTFEDLIFFHRRIHDTNFVSSISKNVHHCSSNVNRKSHVFDITSPLNLMICLPPKCGTTNWQRAMSAVYLNHTQKNYNPKELLGHSMYKILPRVDLEKLRKATETRSSKFKENRFRIANVRNPFSRLYSAWGDKQRVTSSYLSYWRGVKPFQEALGNPPQGMNNSFTAFAQYVAANPGNSKMNFHWTSTFSQCHPCAIDYNIITHLENSGEESEVIMKMLGLGEDVKLGEKYAWSPAKADELKWQSVPRGTAKKIYRHYYLDFVLFGYSPDEVMKFINATDETKEDATFEQEKASRDSMQSLMRRFYEKYTDVICTVPYQ